MQYSNLGFGETWFDFVGRQNMQWAGCSVIEETFLQISAGHSGIGYIFVNNFVEDGVLVRDCAVMVKVDDNSNFIIY